MEKDVLVIGAGVAGLKAAAALDEFGIGTVIVEKMAAPGGKVKDYAKIFPTFSSGKLIVKDLLDRIGSSARVRLSTATEVRGVGLKNGRFRADLSNGQVVDAGAIIVSAGFDSFDPKKQPEYGYGVYPNVISSVELAEIPRSRRPDKRARLKTFRRKTCKEDSPRFLRRLQERAPWRALLFPDLLLFQHKAGNRDKGEGQGGERRVLLYGYQDVRKGL